MKQHAELADRYLESWNETDGRARRALIERIWSDTGRYADPMAKAEGHEGLDAMIATIQTSMPRRPRSVSISALG